MSLTSLTQREYNSVRQILKSNNVILATYSDISTHLKTLPVGTIQMDYCNCDTNCMAALTDLHETLSSYLKNSFWWSKMSFTTSTGSLIDDLKEKSDIYKHLNPKNRTIFLRVTGDNFRAACKQPTEQISYSILNIMDFVNSPYGQILAAIFRGKETRNSISNHVHSFYEQLSELLEHGLTIALTGEQLNVIPIMCADLGF